jgi:23S rRNA (adenine2503-C2)-methyltransferase
VKVNSFFNEFDGCDIPESRQEAIDHFHRYLLDKNITVITRPAGGRIFRPLAVS